MSLTHLIAYESFIGARLGQSFRLTGLIRIESCYDLYTVEPMFETSRSYEARAYTFQGLKYKERKYRMRHFSRCQGNSFCEQSLEQGGKKWVVLRCASKKEKEVLFPSCSPHVSSKEISIVLSCNKGESSGSPSQIPTAEVSKQLARAKERMRDHAPESTRQITQQSVGAHQAMQLSRLELQTDFVQINLDESKVSNDADPPKVAKGSATASSSLRPTNGPRPSTLPLSNSKERAGDSKSGSRGQKSPEQRERRRERRRRAQQVRRMIKSDEKEREPTPRVFMQWEKAEVRRLLRKHVLTLESAHEAELQKQKHTLELAHGAELEEQAAIMTQRDRQHREEMRRLRTFQRIESRVLDSSLAADYCIRQALTLLERVDDNTLWGLKGLLERDFLEDHVDEQLHCEYYL